MAKTPQKPPVITRKHLVGLQKERYYNRLLLLGTGIVVLVVIALVSWGSILQAFVYPSQNVAVVEDIEIKGREYQARVRIYRAQLVTSYLQTRQQYLQMQSLFGDDPTFNEQFKNQLYSYQTQLIPEIVGQVGIEELVDGKLLQLEAAEMGIQISPEQVEQEIQNLFQFFPVGTPTPLPQATTAATSTLSAVQLALITATPSPTVTPTLALSPTVEVSPTVASSPTPAVVETGAATIVPTAEPSPTPYTLEGFQTSFADYVKAIGVSEDDFRSVVYDNLVRRAVKDVITADLPRTQEQVWIRHILVATEEEAQAVLDRLTAGEDFSTLAAELSTDSSKDTGGDLAWFSKEQMGETIANFAFELSIGEFSEPVQTESGFYIIQVLGHEDRPLDQTAYDQVREQFLKDFILTLRDKYTWDVFDVWKEMIPEQPDIPLEARLQ